MSSLFRRSKKKKSSSSKKGGSSLFRRDVGGDVGDVDDRKYVSEDETDTFTGDKAFDKAVVRRVFGNTVIVKHKSGPKHPKDYAKAVRPEDIESTYTRYTKKDLMYKHRTEQEKRITKRYDKVIDKEYDRADKKRKRMMRGGRRPTHRSIERHYGKKIKSSKFTPDLDLAKKIKDRKRMKIKMMKKRGEIDEDEE